MSDPLTLADLLGQLSEVRRDGDGFLALCPAHEDTRPSLRISVSDAGKVLVKCRAGCETDAVLDALRLTMADLATMVQGNTPMTPVASAPLPASPTAIASLAMQLDGYARALTEAPEAAPARAYAHDRFGLTDEDIVRFGLGYSTDQGTPRLVVPFRDPDGIARNFQGRALSKRSTVRWRGPHSPEGGAWSPLGYFPGAGGTWTEVIVTEGPGDALTAAAAGYDTIAVAGASRVNSPAIVSEIAAWVGDRPVVIAGDDDQAGHRFTATLASGLTGHGKRVHELILTDGQDLNELRQASPSTFADDLQARISALVAQTPLTKTEAALREWDEDEYPLTDLGAARYLRDHITATGSGVRFADETGFYLLDGGVWRLDDQQRVRTHAQAVADIARELAIAAATAAIDNDSAPNRARAARRRKFSHYIQTSRGLTSVLRELEAVEGVPVRLSELDRHPHLLAVRNGVVDLRTGALRPHDASLMLTRRIEWDYVPEATAPRWEQFLREVFPGQPDMPAYIQRLVGYGITGRTDEQCFIVHYGKGSNGKSVFTETLTDLFRDITVTTPFSTFEQRQSSGVPNDLAALKGARLVFATEGDQGRIMAEALIKRVTGRDMISARFMRKEFFEFRPEFLLQLSTNNKPAFRGQDEGLWRRVKLIPWTRYFAPNERDPKLTAKLLAEGEGILAWAVHGAVEWYQRGTLGDPDVIREATADYRATSNALDGFFPGMYETDPAGATIVLGQALYADYLEWADEEHLAQREVWTRRAFFGAMEERGFAKQHGPRGVQFVGIRRAANAPRTTTAPPDVYSVPPATPTQGPLHGADLTRV